MGATNFTTYYNLSQFIGTDKPAWLQDYNGDMLKIDTAINGAKTAADAAALAASTAQGTADANTGSISTLTTTVSTHTNQITSLSGAINTINSLLGNGTPTTTDHTIIGGINEINAKVGNLNELVIEITNAGSETATSMLDRLHPYCVANAGKKMRIVAFDTSDNKVYFDLSMDRNGVSFIFTRLAPSATQCNSAFYHVKATGSEYGYWQMNTGGNSYNDASADTSLTKMKLFATE